MTPVAIARFNRHTKKTDGCWLWLGSSTSRGYGTASVIIKYGKKYITKNVMAHRLALLIYAGVNPKDKNVLHTCDNTKCVNPDHLKLGTQQDNIDDCLKKERNNFGSKNGHSKLTEEQAVEILRLRSTYCVPEKITANIFHVSQATVNEITTGVRRPKFRDKNLQKYADNLRYIYKTRKGKKNKNGIQTK